MPPISKTMIDHMECRALRHTRPDVLGRPLTILVIGVLAAIGLMFWAA